jgi:hypothetical protein
MRSKMIGNTIYLEFADVCKIVDGLTVKKGNVLLKRRDRLP